MGRRPLAKPAATDGCGVAVNAAFEPRFEGAPVPRPWMRGPRDLRIDLLRGLAMAIVVVDHLPVPSHFAALTVERIGVVTGAELFVALSGLAVGMAHRHRIARAGWLASTSALIRRALMLYVVVVAVALLAALWATVPGFHGQVLTTWSDESGRSFQVVEARPWASPEALAGVLRMESSPWQFNIIGLYVVLLLLAPLALRALAAGRAGWLLAGSLALHMWAVTIGVRLSDAAFETPFPLLVWQFPFVCGLVGGFRHVELTAFAGTSAGRALRWFCVICAAVFAAYAWNNPWPVAPYRHVHPVLRLHIVPEAWFNAIYAGFFRERTWFGPGRLLNTAVLLVAALDLLRLQWLALARGLGWWALPVGQKTLVVFVAHLALLPLVDALAPYLPARMLAFTALHAAVLLVLWGVARMTLRLSGRRPGPPAAKPVNRLDRASSLPPPRSPAGP